MTPIDLFVLFILVSKHSDVLTCIETRLSMLSMTYQKYIQNGSACFIPGKVIDECYKILRSISIAGTDTTRNLRAHEILQELRDISSMAIEHFDEKIIPDIKKNRPDANVSISSIYDLLTSTPRNSPSYDCLSFGLSRNSSSSSVSHKEEQKRSKTSLSSIVKLYKKQSKIIKGQSKQIAKMMRNITKMKRQLIESEIKNREVTESIKQLKLTSKPLPTEEPSTSARPPKRRTATMVLKRRLDE